MKIDYPRIPFYSPTVFNKFVELGKRLIKLQTEFDKVDCHANNNNVASAHCVQTAEETQWVSSASLAGKTPCHNLKIEKDLKYMPEGIENPNKNKFFDFLTIKKDKATIILDAKNRISNIPKRAFDYKIGTRSALDWIVDYYKPKKLNPQKELHHKTLIENNLTNYDWENIRKYLFDLIPKVVNISVEIVEIFEELEKFD